MGLHDEIFQGLRSVLAGVDAKSTFCCLLADCLMFLAAGVALLAVFHYIYS
jgi:hypothetical protein